MGITLTGCSYDDYNTNVKLLNEFFSKLMYFYQGGSGGGNQNGNVDSGENNENQGGEDNSQTQKDFLVSFKNSISEGKFFTLTKTAQTKYSTVSEEVYFLGSYIYKRSQIIDNQGTITHKLYLESGLTYVYNGTSVYQDKSVDFVATKTEILRDLFGDSIVWERLGDGYTYKNGNYEYYLCKGENENSLNYEIRYTSYDTWAEYKGEVKLIESFNADMPTQLKQYI